MQQHGATAQRYHRQNGDVENYYEQMGDNYKAALFIEYEVILPFRA